MTVGRICHAVWEMHDTPHICGRTADHDGWHLCVCGELLLTGRSSLTDEQRAHREPDCPECLARSGRPCHTTAGAVMSGVHARRAALAERH